MLNSQKAKRRKYGRFAGKLKLGTSIYSQPKGFPSSLSFKWDVTS